MSKRAKLTAIEGGANRPGDAGKGGISNGQRAFWTLLFYMLIAPFFGGLAGAAMFAGAAVAGIAPEPFAGKPLAETMTHIAPIGVTAFVWSVIPAALTAISLFPMIWKSGTVSLFVAGAIGVITFTAAILVLPFPTAGLQPLVMFVAGLISVACRAILVNIGILRLDPPADTA